MGLIALAQDDFCVRILDIASRKIIRKFKHSASIMDLSWSPDSRWITVSTMDRIVRTWDIATGFEIHRFKTKEQVTSLDWSQDSRWLATSHANSPGIYLW